ncbi:MAG: hypothetical protein EOP56_09130 [Sphingobacteriales bacterium]|nr:MAG: hypothetical protein EOP56_09130 [Sphingobacteriales bacterium]
MRLECTDRKTFELTDGDEKLGMLIYDGLFSLKAHATIGNDSYEIKSSGLFSTSMVVIKEENEMAKMKMNWKGQIIISYKDERTYILKPAGMFMNKYVIEDSNEQKLMLLTPDFNWSKFTYNYNISYEQRPQDTLLVLLAVYAANYYITSMSAAV